MDRAPSHALPVERFAQNHDTSAAHEKSERKTRIVLVITAVVMVLELVVGMASHSMALTADGWHMGTHAGAFTVAAFGYWFARTRAKDARFSFGTGKVYSLAGFASAIGLGAVAVFMVVESVSRLLSPEPIAYGEALPVAIFGLVVNLLTLVLLGPEHAHDHGGHGHDHADHDHHHAGHDHGDHDHHHGGHDHDHADHDHDHHHGGHDHAHTGHAHHEATHHGHDSRDHNLRGVYLHVLADSATSVLAIAALAMGAWLGIAWLDPVMGLVGAALILHWARGLVRTTAAQLLDVVPSRDVEQKVRATLEAIDDARVTDLHVWQIGPDCRACIVSIVTHTPREPSFYRARVAAEVQLGHLTVEVHPCPEPGCKGEAAPSA